MLDVLCCALGGVILILMAMSVEATTAKMDASLATIESDDATRRLADAAEQLAKAETARAELELRAQESAAAAGAALRDAQAAREQAGLDAALAAKVAAERDQAAERLSATNERLTAAEAETADLRRRFDELKATSESAQRDLERRARESADAAEGARRDAETARSQAEQDAALAASLSAERNDLNRRLTVLLESERNRLDEAGGDAETAALIGLKGRFEKVAFLFDTSTSMDAGNQTINPEHLDLLKRWVTGLKSSEFTLIRFSSAVATLEGGMLAKNRDNVARARQFIDSFAPHGGTETRAALEAAFKLDADTIILFTDGAPDDGGNEVESAMQDVLDYAREQCAGGKAVINVVGIGDMLYSDRRFHDFLLRLAGENKGAFIGR